MARRNREPQITFSHYQAFAFGSDEHMVATFGSLADAEAEWFRLRDPFLERWNLWGRPQAWWRFEPDIPEGLRNGPALILTEADGDEWRAIEQARRRYLVSLGIDPAPDLDGRPFGSS